MIRVNKKSKIYILCPAYVKTGGTELMHQLEFELLKQNIEAYIVYTEVKANSKKYTPTDFEKYNIKFVLEENIEDIDNNVLIIPEIDVKKTKKYNKIRKAIWWLSVDNYKKNYMFIPAIKLCGKKTALKLLINGNILLHRNDYKKADFHLCQSKYAIDFLKNKKVENVEFLSDYINESYIQISKEETNAKENIVLYNPKKGLVFTKKIIEKANDINFVPIQNLTTDGVKKLLLKSKVYIDFGNHPGKDRFPREAAMCGCCVITGKRGSAKFAEDVPINEEFKFDDNNSNVINIINKIKSCLDNYDDEIKKFEKYREFIKNEKTLFEEDVKNIFEIE